MKVMKVYKLVFVFALVLFGAGLLKAQTPQAGYATMRVFDCNKGVGMGVGYLQSRIYIVYDNGETEEIELLSFSEKTEIENLKRINAALNKLRVKGYFLLSQSTTGEQGSIISEYTFLKQQ
jgi:hypothetical protein